MTKIQAILLFIGGTIAIIGSMLIIELIIAKREQRRYKKKMDQYKNCPYEVESEKDYEETHKRDIES